MQRLCHSSSHCTTPIGSKKVVDFEGAEGQPKDRDKPVLEALDANRHSRLTQPAPCRGHRKSHDVGWTENGEA